MAHIQNRNDRNLGAPAREIAHAAIEHVELIEKAPHRDAASCASGRLLHQFDAIVDSRQRQLDTNRGEVKSLAGGIDRLPRPRAVCLEAPLLDMNE